MALKSKTFLPADLIGRGKAGSIESPRRIIDREHETHGSGPK